MVASHNPRLPVESSGEQDHDEIVNVLQSYFTEAKNAREGGANPRDRIWEANWDRYWGRYDHSKKAPWQSKHVMPETPQFVDRWAAAMREALDLTDEWFTAVDETGQSNDLTPHINRVMKIILSRCGVSPDGHPVSFSSVFEDQMKLGAIMTCAASVSWKMDDRGGWPAVDTIDPRGVWKDPKGRNLYRVRRYEIDKYELMALADLEDESGAAIYDREAIAQLAAQEDEQARTDRERSTGHADGESAPGRNTITIDEWLATVISPLGEVIARNSLIVVANDRFIIRGPEENPFWHGQDWVVMTPMVSVPMSVYGKSYMEEWSEVADAFIEMTNLIMDAAYTSAIKAFAAQVDLLKDPTQIAEGVSPNIVFLLEEGVKASDFMREIDLGTISPDAVRVWTALKQEMREGAKLSEIALGQLPPGQHHTATAVAEVSQSGSAIIRSMARTIEVRFLEVVLYLVWKTALQHMDFEALAPEIGQAAADMLTARRSDFANRRIHFRVRGISGLIDRQTKLRNLLSFLQIASQNEALYQSLLQRTTPDKLLNLLMRLFGIDPADIELSQVEMMMASMAQGGQDGT